MWKTVGYIYKDISPIRTINRKFDYLKIKVKYYFELHYIAIVKSMNINKLIYYLLVSLIHSLDKAVNRWKCLISLQVRYDI